MMGNTTDSYDNGLNIKCVICDKWTAKRFSPEGYCPSCYHSIMHTPIKIKPHEMGAECNCEQTNSLKKRVLELEARENEWLVSHVRLVNVYKQVLNKCLKPGKLI